MPRTVEPPQQIHAAKIYTVLAAFEAEFGVEALKHSAICCWFRGYGSGQEFDTPEQAVEFAEERGVQIQKVSIRRKQGGAIS